MTDYSRIGGANLDWDSLGFKYLKTPFRFIAKWADGAWNEGILSEDNRLPLSEGSTCFNYGQAAFEGMKAYTTKEGRAALFRPELNAKRMATTAERLLLQTVPESLFLKAVHQVVEANLEYLPPYGTGASLYLRPLLLGVGDNLGLHPSKEYMFVVYACPSGAYFSDANASIRLVVYEDYHRAAPKGIGHVKASANYAATLQAKMKAIGEGFQEVLYLDAAGSGHIEETGASNLILIKGNTFVTPKSASILPSITRISLVELAASLGFDVQERPVHIDELSQFDEAACCGTAAVLAPVREIVHGKISHQFSTGPESKTAQLCRALCDIQVNNSSDTAHCEQWLSYLD